MARVQRPIISSVAYAKRYLPFRSKFPDEGPVAFEYGADGKRRQRLAGTDERWYNWGMGYAVLSEADGTGALTRTYVGGTLAHIDGAAPGSGTYVYYGHDHLGSTRALYDASKNETGRFEYSPYGRALYTSNADATPRRYTGHDWDADAGLYFAPFRYYSPATARWTTRDPLGMVDGPNVYGYVWHDPVSSIDPLGLRRCDWFDKFAEGFGRWGGRISTGLLMTVLPMAGAARFVGAPAWSFAGWPKGLPGAKIILGPDGYSGIAGLHPFAADAVIGSSGLAGGIGGQLADMFVMGDMWDNYVDNMMGPSCF